ncbi:MAG: hypothetical protein Q9168_007919 [Polycauliona sp. 1 TL-2023]
MKDPSIFTALSSTLLFSSALARYGLNPDDISMLTRTVDYTFHSICNDFHNPVPIAAFDEQVPISLSFIQLSVGVIDMQSHTPPQGLAKTIFDITNDLYSFLMGYSVGGNQHNDFDLNEPNDNENGNQRIVLSKHPSLRQRLHNEKQRQPSILQTLIDDMIQSTRRSELLESQTVVSKGPVGEKVMQQETTTMHRYAAKGKKFDCPKFQHDVYDVSLLSILA